MDLFQFREAVLKALEGPLKVLPRVKLQAHAGRFDLAGLQRYAVQAPAVFLAVLRAPLVNDTAPAVNVELAAYVLTKRSKEHDADQANLIIGSLLLGVLASAAPGEGGRPLGLRYDNLYSVALDAEGVALGAVTWTQQLVLDAAESSDLGDFLKLYATYDLGPADTRIEAVSQIDPQGPLPP